MSRIRKAALTGLFALLAIAFIAPSIARAYSVKVHIHLANAIRDDLVKNWDATDRPMIKLLAPEGAEDKFVELRLEDAEAIRDFPEFFRAGAIGPDNTVLSGLTDPSHAWMFSPFTQCETLLDASANPEERAYALGCFLHGISDNAAHHVVNYFTGQTFTLYPVDAAENGELKFSLINVVRHITVEGKFEKAIATAKPEEFTEERLTHRIPIALVRRVYFEDEGGKHGLWRFFAGHLVQKKNDALRAAQLDGFEPRDLDLTIEDIKASGVTVDLDGRVMQAYIDFLSTGGEIVGVSPGEMTPADYVLFLPELVADVRRLMAISVVHGEKKLADVKAEWVSEGECAITCPLLKLRKELYEHLFDPAANEGQSVSRVQQAVDRKNGELDKIVDGYIMSVEKLSNNIVTKGIGGMGLSDITESLTPLTDAIEEVADFPYDILFPDWAVTVINHVEGLKKFMEGCFTMMVQVVTEQIVARMTAYLDTLRQQVVALQQEALAAIGINVEELKQKLHDTLDAAKLEAIGLDIDDAAELFDNFGNSVLYMNTFNSVVGALGNEHVVVPHEIVPGFFSGPVSFDASYQLTYNQLSLCEDLSAVFYPCGITATEMLQPSFAKCQKLDADVVPDTNVECHRFDEAAFLDNPDPDACRRTQLDELIAPTDGHIGSYTLAYPAELASPAPICINPQLVGINADSFDDTSADDLGDGEGASGCGCQSTNAGAGAIPLLGLLLGFALIRRRRRA